MKEIDNLQQCWKCCLSMNKRLMACKICNISCLHKKEPISPWFQLNWIICIMLWLLLKWSGKGWYEALRISWLESFFKMKLIFNTHLLPTILIPHFLVISHAMCQFQRWTSKFGELWSPAQQQIWPWKRSRSQHGANWKGLSQGSCMPNINALPLILKNIWARLKFLWQTDGQRDGQTDRRTNEF